MTQNGENGEGHATEHSATPHEKSAVHKDAPAHHIPAEAPELGSPCCTDDDEPHATQNGSKHHASQIDDIGTCAARDTHTHARSLALSVPINHQCAVLASLFPHHPLYCSTHSFVSALDTHTYICARGCMLTSVYARVTHALMCVLVCFDSPDLSRAFSPSLCHTYTDAEALERDRRLSDEITSLSLNPLAEEFRPPKNKDGAVCAPPAGLAASGAAANGHAEFYAQRSQGESSSTNDGSSDRGSDARLMQNGGSSSGGSGGSRHQRAGKRARGRNNKHVNMESVRRTVYVCDIENSVTEEQLASLFSRCGQVIDCRICGDPNSALRFAFVEFTTEASAATALMLNGAILNYQQLQVLPSKTPIVPVNPVFLPQSQGELETCSRTIYVTNIDKIVRPTDDTSELQSFEREHMVVASVLVCFPCS